MAARSIGNATISFGLVSIPVRLYVATHSEQLSFNQIHAPCGSRIKQQILCPRCERPVERGELLKGYQFEKDRYVTFTDEELKAVEAEASRNIDIHEFVPLASVDPLYFEGAHYLGPQPGAEKAYQLLVAAMRDRGTVALAQFVHHGKEHLVLIRPVGEGLVMHTMHYADEVRRFDDVDTGGTPKIRSGEIELARKLVDQLSADTFRPDQYKDAYRDRVREVVDKKIAGEAITTSEPPPARAQVIDLMEALKASLSRPRSRGGARATPEAAPEARRPAAAARRREPQARSRARKK
jgi:DNA end-binding protein Ku